jgi:outer membrane lipopolysaccharide assembly protein LptE/RlpB
MKKKRQSLLTCLMAILLPAAGFSQVSIHRESPKHPPTEDSNRLDVSGTSDNGLKATVKTNLSSNQISVNYDLPQDGKAILEIVSIDGALLKSVTVDGTKGKHAIILDAPLLKNKMAVLVIKQGNNKTSSLFLIAQ